MSQRRILQILSVAFATLGALLIVMDSSDRGVGNLSWIQLRGGDSEDQQSTQFPPKFCDDINGPVGSVGNFDCIYVGTVCISCTDVIKTIPSEPSDGTGRGVFHTGLLSCGGARYVGYCDVDMNGIISCTGKTENGFCSGEIESDLYQSDPVSP